jgi:hypothetical protein
MTNINNGMIKKCSRCKKIKELNEFYDRKRYKDGKSCQCKECLKDMGKISKRKNEKQVKKYNIEYRKENILKIKEYHKNLYLENREKILERQKKYVKSNYEKRYEYQKEWISKNRDKRKTYWDKNNKLVMSTADGRLNSNFSRAIRSSICSGKGGRHWETVVGYSLKQLNKHLEKKFLPGMTWENYGRKGWNIDHIIPVSAFNFKTSDDIDFKKCWALNNLRPLWEIENIKKKNKLIKNFQPSFSFN